MSYAKGYYAGGYRAVIEGVPIRLARKPSAHNLAWSRSWERYLNSDASSFLNAAERRAQKAKEARDMIGIYAEALEITENQAKARIAAQRQHVAQNPLVDLSLEYDL